MKSLEKPEKWYICEKVFDADFYIILLQLWQHESFEAKDIKNTSQKLQNIPFGDRILL